MSNILYQKKLTMATCGLGTRDNEEAAKGKKDVAVCRVAGTIAKMEAKSSDLGPYVLFSGEFVAVNLLTSQEYRSGSLIVPGVAEVPLVSEVSGANGNKVKFALDITVSENISSKGGTKFKYGVRSLIEPSAEDELSQTLKALPPPGAKAKK